MTWIVHTLLMKEIPLFPLSLVLFPGGKLPLQIFEARYMDLVKELRKNVF